MSPFHHFNECFLLFLGFVILSGATPQGTSSVTCKQVIKTNWETRVHDLLLYEHCKTGRRCSSFSSCSKPLAPLITTTHHTTSSACRGNPQTSCRGGNVSSPVPDVTGETHSEEINPIISNTPKNNTCLLCPLARVSG